MATLASFWSLFGDRMADLGLIDFKLGLYIKINVNNGQNKFEVHISKNVAKMAILWPKIGQRHFGAHASHGHNLAIFHQILTNEHIKMTSSLRRIEWNKILSSISLFYILVFWPHFCSEASHGQCCTYGLKTTLKLLVHILAIMASSYLKIVFLQKSGLNPPLKVRKNSTGKNNFNNLKNPPQKMGKLKFNHVKFFLKPLDLVVCIIIVRICIINMPIGEITSKFVTKGTLLPTL